MFVMLGFERQCIGVCIGVGMLQHYWGPRLTTVWPLEVSVLALLCSPGCVVWS